MRKLTNKILKVNRLLIGTSIKRFQSQSTSLRLALLPKRGVLEVHGRDASKLLQGLITNDMTLLSEENCKVIHTYVLNVQGRILYDLFIYQNQSSNDDSYLVECDLDERENLSTYLKRYKLRSKVKFSPREELNVYSLFGSDSDLPNIPKLDNIHEDPRLSLLGARLVTDQNFDNVLEEMKNNGLDTTNENAFRIHRYCLGVTEGVDEISNGIPLEYNGALTNSINFQKGCYVGQELVARAHFTGVIRKRVMPLTFDLDLSKSNITDTSIYNGKGRRAGKLLGYEQNTGVGLVRLKDALDGNGKLSLKLDETEVGVVAKQPSWWPDSLEY